MPQTKRYANPKTRFPGTDPKVAPAPVREVQSRIPCSGKAADEVLDQLSRALAQAEARDVDPLIVLENLGQLADSVASLIKGLCRLLDGYPRTVTFWESSGYAEAFLSVMEKQERRST